MSSSTQNLLPVIDLGNTFGAAFIGAAFAAILIGVSNVQVFIYFQTHSKTTLGLFKLAVITLWILDALHLAFVIHSLYYYLVSSYGNPEVLTYIIWSGKLQIALNMFTVWCTHSLYAYRIWIVNTGRSRALPAAVGIIVMLSLGLAIVVTYKVYRCHLFTDLLAIEWATLTYLGTITFIDFVIASSLCYIIATSRTGFSSTDSFLTRLMVYTINTGCLTSVFSVTACITCAVMPNNFIYITTEFLVARLYVNSFLALMNARYYLQPNGTERIDISEFHARRPTLQSNMKSIPEDLQVSQLDAFKVPHNGERWDIEPQLPIAVNMGSSHGSSSLV